MKPKILALVALLTVIGLATGQSAAQDSNNQLEQAVCSQDWRQALRIVNQMIAATPQQSERRVQLETYRNQLQGLSESRANIPNWSASCSTGTGSVPTRNTPTSPATNSNVEPSTDALSATANARLIVSNLNQLVAMTFDPNGRLFFTEKSGKVRLIVNNTLVQRPVYTFNVDACSERGLLGIALDPAFSSNRYVYVYYTAATGTACGPTKNRVVRFTEVNGIGQNPVTIFTAPAVGAGNHNGGNLHFGPDRKLYVSVGDDSNPANSQNLGSKNGKIHRINSDGSIPSDNPFYGQPGKVGSIFAYGLRNSFDFDFDPVTGVLFASENGPNCDDEVNRILRGHNYGWRPNYPCGDAVRTYNTIPPLIRWTPSIAPTGITFFRGSQRKQLFMCSYKDGKLHRLRLNQSRTRILEDQILSLGSGASCREEVETGKDGALYFVAGGGYTPATLYRLGQ